MMFMTLQPRGIFFSAARILSCPLTRCGNIRSCLLAEQVGILFSEQGDHNGMVQVSVKDIYENTPAAAAG